VIPLIRFTSSHAVMGEFVNRTWIKVVAWSMAALIVGLNFWLAAQDAVPWTLASGWRMALGIPFGLAVLALLGWVTFAPHRTQPTAEERKGAMVAAALGEPVYHRILVPLDHSKRDRAAIAHAAAMARLHGAVIHLFHVEEGAISQLYGALASTAEEQSGEQYLRDIADTLERQGLKVELTVLPGRSPKDEIVRVARETNPDLVVMGAHGHTGIKDLIFGNTINGVRHAVAAPVLVVGGEK
jgi:manganese transport protein